MQAEITAHIKLDQHCSLSAKVTDEMTKDNKSEKIEEIKTVVTALLKDFTPSQDKMESKVKFLNTPEEKRISGRQIGMIKFLLGQQDQDVKSFCRKHSISRLEELSMQEARTVIQDLKTSTLFDE